MSITGSEQWMYNAGGSFYDYLIEQSVRITSGGSLKNDTVANTTRTYDSAKIFTYSCWFKPQGNGVHLISLNDTPAAGEFTILYDNDNTFRVYSNGQFDGDTTAVFRDFSAWYHVCLVMDTTQATAANRARLYINGTLHALSSQPSQNLNVKAFTTATRGAIGARYQDNGVINYQGSNGAFHIAEFIYADGVKHEPTVFGETKSGVWIPKDVSSISLGTNGYHLDFSDQTLNTSTTTNSGFGKDVRSNMPNPQWITQGNLAVHDGMLDSPTVNYATANVLAKGGNITLAEGNLRVDANSSTINSSVPSTIGMTTGKWYAEYYIVNPNTSNSRTRVGISSVRYLAGSTTENQSLIDNGSTIVVDGQSQFRIFENGTQIENSGTVASGSIIGIAFDADAQTVEFYLNGVKLGTSTPYDVASVGDGIYYFAATQRTSADGIFNFGQDSTFAGATTAGGNSDANGYGDFAYPVPNNFLALNAANLPEPSITPLDDDIPDDYFNTVLYSGNGSTQSVTGVGFQPNLLWLKSRTNTNGHVWVDSVRGSGLNGLLYLLSNSTGAEVDGGGITSLDSDGFTLDSSPGINGSGRTFVSWNWKAGTSFSNSAGANGADIASSGSVSTKSGFSIVSYTGSNTANDVVYHGIGTAPSLIIIKNRDVGTSSGAWGIFTDRVEAERLQFDTNDDFNNYPLQSFDANTFQLPTLNNVAWSFANNYIAYCFASIEGYSKIGIYTGNNNSSNGTFVYTGFRPAFVITKKSNGTSNWNIIDNHRPNENNPANNGLLANSNLTESTLGTSHPTDLLSNGFKFYNNEGGFNGSATYLYMAFAEMPFKYANAR